MNCTKPQHKHQIIRNGSHATFLIAKKKSLAMDKEIQAQECTDDWSSKRDKLSKDQHLPHYQF